ncbi:MAG: T9SS type A sorting domain-containing protein [Flavobacteriales bacterium]|nr:T9SS type A sorting domain-containing protein [Flavobacteriales bacterium]
MLKDGNGNILVATSTGYTHIINIYNGVPERAADSFRLVPNPANAFVDVMLDEAISNATVGVLDASGRVVIQERLSGQRLRFDVSMLQAGLYFMRIGDRAVRFAVER